MAEESGVREVLQEKKRSGQEDRLQIEPGVLLQVEASRKSEKSRLVGFDHGRFIVITTPPLTDIWTELYQENSIIVRYLYKGKVYGFRSTLLGFIEKPFPVSFLAYPRNIECYNLRKQERVDCFIPGRADIEGVAYEGMIWDISAGGCCFTFNVPEADDLPEVSVGDVIRLILSILEPGINKPVQAQIMSVRKKGRKVRVGTKFMDIDAACLQTVQTYIDSVMQVAF
jgi:hypothetical protein